MFFEEFSFCLMIPCAITPLPDDLKIGTRPCGQVPILFILSDA